MKSKEKIKEEPSPRLIAVNQLLQLDRASRSFYSDETLPIRAQRDHRLVKEYIQGIMRQRRWLDFVLDHYYSGDLKKIETKLLWILRLGVYDLLMLRTPAHAAINEAVELAKKEVRAGAGKLANGILRTVDRNRYSLPDPSGLDEIERMGVTYSHPDWLVKRWIDRYGDDVQKLLEWNNSRPVYSVRINTSKITIDHFKNTLDKDGIEWEDGLYLKDFVRVPQLQPLLRGGYLTKGLCAVQDESAGLVVHLLDPQPGEFVVDACAAPGGKTLYCASLMDNTGELLALDVQEERLNKLRRVQQAYNADWVSLAPLDVRTAQIKTKVDRLLLDVPCTGLGVLSKRADLRWRRTAEDLKTIVNIQRDLLSAAAHWIKPGGYLVYSTCTIAPEENEEQIEFFLEKNPQYEIEPASFGKGMVAPDGYLTTVPHVHKIDGAFAAKLKRKAD